ncbi:MAG: PKD-like domain-containing protein, partial [Phaeodactylibacter sp.]|uniref:PKD domain-containing protein n=1 Tax=Phaeodactylibacter sp. TaxID=1940289 RepID=UPI0032EABD7A
MLFLLASTQLSAQNCTVNAGINRTFCATDEIRLFGQIQGSVDPSAPVWSQISGPSVLIDDPSALSPQIIGVLSSSTYMFRLQKRCLDGSLVFDDVTYTISATPEATATGGGPAACPGGGSATLSGNTPASGETGLWTGGGAGVVLSDANDPNPSITLTEGAGGTANFVWTVTDDVSGCTASSEAIAITNCGGVSTVTAGPDQTLNNCFLLTTATSLSGSAIGLASCGQSGQWSVVSGPNIPTFSSPTTSSTSVSNLIEGTYLFRYDVDGPCASGSDFVQVTVPKPVGPSTPASAFAPAGNAYCVAVDAVILQGNLPIYSGEVVEWVQLSGPSMSTIVSPNTQVTEVTNFVPGTYTYQYTITNPVTGCTSSANVSISIGDNPTLDITDVGPISLSCGQTSVPINYTASGLGGTTWRFLDRPIGTTPSPYSSVSSSSPFTVTGLGVGGTYVIEFRRSAGTNTGCTASTDQITVVSSGESTLSNAGTDQLLACNITSTMLAGNDPLIEGSQFIGTWSQVSGPNTASIVDANDFGTDISGLIPGQYVFRWTITNGALCPPAQDDVIVRVANIDPQSVDAGLDQTVCFGTPIQLDASTAQLNEIGTWSVSPSAGVVFSDINDPNATVTGLSITTVYTFTWSVQNSCNTITDDVLVSTTGTQGPIQADAGDDQCIGTAGTITNLAGNNPSGGTGTWTFLPAVSDPITITVPTITSPNDPNTSITGLTDLGTYAFQWEIARGSGCEATLDTVLVTRDNDITEADAGPDKGICGTSTTLEGNTPTVGMGTWTQLSGPTVASIVDENLATTTVENLLVNTTYFFIWTIENGGCEPSRDTVGIATSSQPELADAGDDIGICGASSTTLAANVVADGYWTVISGPNTPSFSDNTSPTATISNLVFGTYILQWNSQAGGFCPIETDQMELEVVPSANAGSDQDFCELVTNVNLSGNSASTGTWSFVSGPNTPTVTATGVGGNTAIASGLIEGVYVFEYTINTTLGNGTDCMSSDQMTVSIFDVPSAANAGTDQELCDETTFNLDAAVPAMGTGMWTVASTSPAGLSGTFTDATDPATTFTGAEPGVYIFQWEVATGECSGSDLVRIDNYDNPTPSNAGNAFDNCGFTAQLAGNTPIVGLGEWTVISTPIGAPTPNILNPILSNTLVTNLVTGDYTFRWTITSGPVCVPSEDDVVVTVIENPTQPIANDINICPDPIPTTAALQGNAIAVGTGTWSVASQPMGSGVIGFDDVNDPTTNATNLEYGTYELVWSADNLGCILTDTATILVSEPPTPADVTGSAIEFCEFDQINLVGNTPTVGTVQWSFTSKPPGSPNPFFLNPNSPETRVINTVTGQYTFVYTISAPGCPDETAVLNIEIFPEANLAVIAGGSQALCENELPFAISGSAPQAGETGTWRSIPALSDGTATFSDPNAANTTITAFDVVSGTSTYAIEWTISTGTTLCDSRDTVYLTVWQEPSTSVTAADYEDCAATTLNLDANTPTVGTGLWTRVSGPNTPSITAPFSPNTTITGAIPGVYVYRWTISSGPACTASTDDITITNYEVLGRSGDNAQTVCDGATPTLSAGAIGGNGNYTYQWQQADTDCNGTWTDVVGETGATYTTPALAAVTGSYFYRVIISDDGPCTDFTSNCITVTAVEDPSVTVDPVNDNICVGGTAQFSVTATGGTPILTYQWQYDNGGTWENVTNGSPTGASYTGTTTTNLAVSTDGTTAVGTYDYRVLVNASGLDCDQAISAIAMMEVFADPTISVQPMGDEICPGETYNLGVTAAGTAPGALAYQWEYNNGGTWENVSNGTPGGVTYTGATTDALDVITTNATTPGNYEYRAVITQAESGCETISDEVTVQVNPIPEITSDASDLICDGDNVNYTITSDVAMTTYEWSGSVTSGLVTGVSTTTQTTSSINDVLDNTGSTEAVVTYTITPTGPGPTNCVGAPFDFVVTVEPTPEVNANSTAVICDGGDTDIVLDDNGVVGSVATTYTWTAAVTTAPDGGALTGFSDGSGASITQTLTNTGTNQGVVTYTITPFIGTCAGSAITVDVTVNPSGQVNDPANDVVCVGDNVPELVLTTNNDEINGTTTYSWANNNTAIGLGGAGTGNVPAFTTTNTGTTPITGTITITPTYTEDGVSCVGPTQNYTVTVNPLGQVDDPADQVVCEGDLTTVNFITQNSGGTTSYAWTNDNTDIGLGASGTGNISFTATNTGTEPIIANLVVTPTFENAGESCTGTPQNFTITVNPDGQVDIIADQRVCNGNPTAEVVFSTQNTVGTTTYSWTNNLPSIGLAASGTGPTIPSFNVVNSGNTIVTATITVTPTFENGGQSCEGASTQFDIVVDPTPAATSPGSETICHNSIPALSVDVTAIDGGNYVVSAISNPGVVGGIAGTAPYTNVDGAPVETGTLTNTTSTNQTVTYTIQPYTNGPNGVDDNATGDDCLGTPFDVDIIVEPEPSASASAGTEVICGSTAPTVTVDVTALDGNNYQVSAIDNLGGVTGVSTAPYTRADGATIEPNNLTNSTSTTQTVTYEITPYTYGTNQVDDNGEGDDCLGTPFDITIEVEPTPEANPSAVEETICHNSNSTITVDVTAINGTDYLVSSVSNPGNVGGVTTAPYTRADGSVVEPVTLTNTTALTQTVTYTVRAYTFGPDGIDNDGTGDDCLGAPFDIAVEVEPDPAATASAVSETICHGSAPNITIDVTALDGNRYLVSAISNPDGVAGVSTSGYTRADGETIEPNTLTNTSMTNMTQTVTYTITPYIYGPDGADNSGGGDDCEGTPFDVTVTVDPEPEAAPSALSEIICTGTAPLTTVDVTAISGDRFLVNAV